MAVTLTRVMPFVYRIQMERPKVRNALSWRAMEAFDAAVEKAHQLPDLCALIVTGVRDTFSAGGDLKELADFSTEMDGWRLTHGMTQTLNRLAALPCPTIAAINGPARGGGAEIALACDLRVIEADADLGLVHIRLGLTPGWGGGQRLLRLVGYSRALEWLITGKVISAQEAFTHGVVNRVVPAGKSWDEALGLARQFADHPPAAVRAMKRLLCAGVTHPAHEAADIEQAEFPPVWADDAHHALVAALLKRPRS